VPSSTIDSSPPPDPTTKGENNITVEEDDTEGRLRECPSPSRRKLAYPDCQSVAVVGDGGFAMLIAELNRLYGMLN
jgi:hypothetical protein